MDVFDLPNSMGVSIYSEFTIAVETPTAAENIVMRQVSRNITIVSLQAVSIGGTSVTIDPAHGPTITTANKLLTAAEAILTANTSGQYIMAAEYANMPVLPGVIMAATFADATLAAGDFFRLVTTAISGVPTQLSLTFQYRNT